MKSKRKNEETPEKNNTIAHEKDIIAYPQEK
jgi:hypothetical protein